MIRVTIELVPFGEEAYKKEIGSIIIANDGTGNQAIGNYDGRFPDDMHVRVEGHSRACDVYTLVYRTLFQRELKKLEKRLAEEKDNDRKDSNPN
jgi:uncharacterized protein involved in tellurium resistance